MQPELPGNSNLGEIISDVRLRDSYMRFLREIRDLHEDVAFEATRMEVRFLFKETVLCRIVPYRELFHVQIGEENPWEVRVRSTAGCLRALDRVLETFFDLLASGGSISAGAG